MILLAVLLGALGAMMVYALASLQDEVRRVEFAIVAFFIVFFITFSVFRMVSYDVRIDVTSKTPTVVTTTHVLAPRCDSVGQEIVVYLEDVGTCTKDSDCYVDAYAAVCPFTCHILKSHTQDGGVADTLLDDKMTLFRGECAACEYTCGPPPALEDLVCHNNHCTEKRLVSGTNNNDETGNSTANDKLAIRDVFYAYMKGGERCDIEGAYELISRVSKEIVNFTCENYAAETKCYQQRDMAIRARGDSAVLYPTPFSHEAENPVFFVREGGEWKIAFAKMAFGMAMAGSTCDSGWSWTSATLEEEFCSYFPVGQCPDTSI